MSEARGAAFLDRDGTIIRDAHYVSRAEDVELLPGAGEAIRRLNEAGVPVIVISNQSGIGRGYFGLDAYERVRARVEALLAAAGARVDATYICPHAPPATGEPACECRKPGTLLYRRAAEAHGLDLARSWYVGDRLRDVQPAAALGGRGILVPTAETPARERADAHDAARVAASLAEAVDVILRERA